MSAAHTTSTVGLEVLPGPTTLPTATLHPPQPPLPACGSKQSNLESVGLMVLGVLLMLLMLRRVRVRRGVAVLLALVVGGLLATATPVSAAEIPSVNYGNIPAANWSPSYSNATPVGSLWDNQFVPPTPAGDTQKIQVGQPAMVNAVFNRPIFTDTGKELVVTLTVWRVEPKPNTTDQYLAKQVYQQTTSTTEYFGKWSFPLVFDYTPTAAGLYFFQFKANAQVNLFNSQKVTSVMEKLEVSRPTAKLSVQAPAVVFPTTGQQPAFTATATQFPQDATDPLNWTASTNLTLEHTTTNPVAFHAVDTPTINWTEKPGLPGALGATAGGKTARADLYIGGLAAIDTAADDLPDAGLTRTTQGLSALGATREAPPGGWHFDWQLVATKQAGSKLVVDPSANRSLSTFKDVKNGAGTIATLDDAAVAFTAARRGLLMQHLIEASTAGTPYVLRLVLEATSGGHSLTIKSNYAGVTVAKPKGGLRIDVAASVQWTYSHLELYDAVAKTQPLSVMLHDTRRDRGWSLSASLQPAGEPFPFELAIAGFAPQALGGPATVIASGNNRQFKQNVALTLQPTAAAGQANASQYHAAIVWTASSTVDTLALN